MDSPLEKPLEQSSAAKTLFDKQQEAVTKFDYFICTVAGALFAYVGEHYEPHRLALSFSLLEPTSILVFALSFYFGIKRIEAMRTHLQQNHLLVAAEDNATYLAQMVEKPGDWKHYSGIKPTTETLKAHHARYVKDAETHLQNCEIFLELSRKYHRYRDKLLIAGVAAIFFAKVLQPYGKGTSQTSPVQTIAIQQTLPLAIQISTPTQLVATLPLSLNPMSTTQSNATPAPLESNTPPQGAGKP